MDYDAYVNEVSDQLEVNSFNREELEIIEGCFDKKWEAKIAASLIETHWQVNEFDNDDEEDYNSSGDYD